jgi:hypothetical protein
MHDRSIEIAGSPGELGQDSDQLYGRLMGRIQYHRDSSLKYKDRYKLAVRVLNLLSPLASASFIVALVFGALEVGPLVIGTEVLGLGIIGLSMLDAMFRPEKTYLEYTSILRRIEDMEFELNGRIKQISNEQEKVQVLIEANQAMSQVGMDMAGLPFPARVSHWLG